MKHKRTLLWILPLLCGAPLVSVQSIVIAQNGEAQSVIVVDPGADQTTRYAVEELTRFLSRVTGANFEIIHAPRENTESIFVGPDAARLADPNFTTNGLNDEGVVMRTVESGLILAGGGRRGTLYAVYTFLEDQIGCRWWAPHASTIPRKPTLVVSGLDFRYVPRLETREYQLKSHGEWAVRNKLNGYENKIRKEHGGSRFTYIAHSKWSSHTFWTLLPPPVYFEDHPEYYTMYEGKRMSFSSSRNQFTSLCLTNQDVLREVVKNSRLALLWHPWANLFSISQTDEGGEPNRCRCEPCSMVEEEDGASGLNLQFVNAVAAELKKDFPEVTFDTLAYHYTQAPPKQTRARNDVIIRLSSIGCSFSTPFRESRDDNPRHNQFRDDLIGWSEKSSRLYVWDYAVNFTYCLLPHPNLYTFAPNIRFLIEHNVVGLMEEADTAFAEVAELRAWLLARLMWDPSLDTRTLIEEFCDGFYGPAGKHVAAYLAVTHDALASTDDYLNLSSPPDAKFLSFDTLSRAAFHLQAATEAVNDDPSIYPRVERLPLSIMYASIFQWEDLQKEAKEAGMEWFLPGSRDDVYREIKRIAAKQGFNLKGISSPIPF